MDQGLSSLLEKIIGSEIMEEQGQLLEALRLRGLEISQPTLSRKLREMGVTKVGGRYMFPEQLLIRQQKWLTSIDVAPPNLLFLRTLSGYGRALSKEIEQKREIYDGVLGTISSEDTLLVVVNNSDLLEQLRTQILDDFS